MSDLEAQRNEEDGKDKKRGKMLCLVGLLAFLLGGGIVAGVWFILDSRKEDSPSPANVDDGSIPTAAPINQDSPVVPPTRTPTRPTGTPPPTPTFAPTSKEEGLYQRLFQEHGPLLVEPFAWLRDSDLYDPQTYGQLVERYALVALFYSTRGDQNLWNFSSGWLSNRSVCDEWFGITCNGSGTVTGIVLPGNSLVGSLPTELGILTSLTAISIVNSFELTGNIPSEIEALTALRQLELRNNYLSGQIPPSITDLISLRILDLENNILTGGLPNTISAMTNLIQLSAGGNELNGPIPILSPLRKLQTLELDRNKLQGSIPDLDNLTSLQKLDLKTNKLVGNIPPLPTSITECDLNWNSFSNTDNGVQFGCFL